MPPRRCACWWATCSTSDGCAVQARDLVARDVLGLLDCAGHAVGDEREHRRVRRGLLVVVTTKHGVSPVGPASHVRRGFR